MAVLVYLAGKILRYFDERALKTADIRMCPPARIAGFA
jgi:hypothetical protein